MANNNNMTPEEIDAMMARIEADVQARRAQREANEKFGKFNDAPVDQSVLEENIRKENLKAAKGFNLFSFLSWGKNDSSPASEVSTEESVKAKEVNVNKTSPAPGNKSNKKPDDLPHVVSVDSGRCGDDGMIYTVTTWSDGSEQWVKM
jgi:hypothetical protein